MRTTSTLAIDAFHHWHPFTQARDAEAFPPLVIDRAKGVFLYDAQGRRYYDTISSWWTNLHGHGHPALTRALHRQAKRLDHVNFSGFTHVPAARLSARLADHLPPTLCRFFYSDNGSTAVEAAVKMAVQYFYNLGRPDKRRVAYLGGAYHGDTLGAVSLSGSGGFHAPFQALRFDSLELLQPDFARPHGFTFNPVNEPADEGHWQAVQALLTAQADSLAAVIVEPLIQCVAGMRPYPAEFLRRLQSLCRSLDILVIYDEVATGFGRTGSLFALDQAGTQPDLLCLAKGLSGGVLPLAVTVTTKAVYQAFSGPRERTFFHGHSYTANPIACAAGEASLRLLEKPATLARAGQAAQTLAEGLQGWAGLAFVRDVRFLGLMAAVDLADPEAGLPLPAAWGLGQRIYRLGLEHGLVLRPLGDTVYWLLPLVLKPAQVRAILEKSRTVIESVLRQWAAEGRRSDGALGGAEFAGASV